MWCGARRARAAVRIVMRRRICGARDGRVDEEGSWIAMEEISQMMASHMSRT
jgi:hypothetical protein